jgi:hypothetical protein
MKGNLLAASVCALALTACSPPTSDGAANNDPSAAAPTYSYTCAETLYKLVLDFDEIEATSGDRAPVTLPALFPMSAEGVATYTDGRISFFVRRGQAQPEVSFARGKMAPTPCTPAVPP